LYVHKNAASFEKAAADAFKVLKINLRQKKENENELPDVITSTVEV